jgi:hypothetical protein
MFSIFKSKSEEDEKEQAKALFEKITMTRAESREVRSMRIRMGLLARAHLDKSFIQGAEDTATWQQLCEAAAAKGKEAPERLEPGEYQKIKSGDTEIMVYLPEEYAFEAYYLGARYQQTDITAEKAIDSMQNLANQICLYELRLDEPFEVLQFLREELAGGGPAAEAAP